MGWENPGTVGPLKPVLRDLAISSALIIENPAPLRATRAAASKLIRLPGASILRIDR